MDFDKNSPEYDFDIWVSKLKPGDVVQVYEGLDIELGIKLVTEVTEDTVTLETSMVFDKKSFCERGKENDYYAVNIAPIEEDYEKLIKQSY